METKIVNKKPELRELALEHGMSFPFDEDLVALILGSGSKEYPVQNMARKIIETLDNSNEKDIIRNLLSIRGIGCGKALAIAAALELGKRRSNKTSKQ